jgi:hypothetical protein
MNINKYKDTNVSTKKKVPVFVKSYPIFSFTHPLSIKRISTLTLRNIFFYLFLYQFTVSHLFQNLACLLITIRRFVYVYGSLSGQCLKELLPFSTSAKRMRSGSRLFFVKNNLCYLNFT